MQQNRYAQELGAQANIKSRELLTSLEVEDGGTKEGFPDLPSLTWVLKDKWGWEHWTEA